MLRTIRNLWRLFAIVRTLARHDALGPLDQFGAAPGLVWLVRLISRRNVPGRPGQRLSKALAELGPSFIKFGQALSTRADLVGEQMAIDLSDLQDRLPPFDGLTARDTIERELGRPLHDVFASFDNQPLSAASIAQVHLATRTDGEEVAVKILRPGIERAFERDLALFLWLADVAERAVPKLRRLKPREVVGVFAETVRIEMDLRMEAAAATELAENFAGDATYRVPAVDWTLSSQRVLTMEKVSGTPIDDREALLAKGHDLREVLTRASAVFFHQVFRDGFFHGDQHPGNMWIDDDGNIVAVDFGIMGRLDMKTRRFLADMLMATLARDYHALALIHAEAGYLPPGASVPHFAQALRAVCDPIAGRELHEISFARLLAQLLQLTDSFDMPVQPQLLLLQKNMLMAEGISRQLDPTLNIWALAQPLIEHWVHANRGPQARLREGAEQLAASLERLPATLGNLEKAINRMGDGETSVDLAKLRGLVERRTATRYHITALWTGIAALAVLWAFA